MKKRKHFKDTGNNSLPCNSGRKRRPNAGVFFAVFITLIILLLVGIYIFFNDTKPAAVILHIGEILFLSL